MSTRIYTEAVTRPSRPCLNSECSNVLQTQLEKTLQLASGAHLHSKVKF